MAANAAAARLNRQRVLRGKERQCIGLPARLGMAELINLRTERKRAQRRDNDLCAASNRLAHGQRKSQRKLDIAKHEKAKRDLDRHRIDR